MEEQNLCINCINCINNLDNNLHDCDYGFWLEKKYNEMLLYTPELFECEEFEDYNKIVKK